ncbi:MAG: 50S ribosomal protein L9 [Candidatus Binatus sp.]|nr:50S ribosomal protein L9 [Candidatus Binatus sp.]MDO8434878.1 50S ribosomal protein L9 [Candidatus Binatus sp.]
MNLQVILNEDLPNLGRTGDVVKVRAGYARNYLLPRKLAVEADQKNIRAFEHQKRIASRRREAKRTDAMAIKAKIEALEITIMARAGEEGKLFGSVTNIDIERAVREKGVDIERRKIVLPEPIKQLGDFTVPVKLDAEVEANLKIIVAAQAE